MDLLTASLLDLSCELEARRVPITVGGGFGLYLKRRHLAQTGERALFEELPEPRSTNDLDLFLRVEVLLDLERTKAIRDAICRLGYTPVEEAKFLQWKKTVLVGGVEQEVKIDVLVGPLGEHRKNLKVSMPRVRPKGASVNFHAHAVEEALHLEDGQIAVTLAGKRTTGTPCQVTVHVPDAFPYLMMKLHAFDDRKDDDDKDLGRHHALDLYTIVGMMTESEYERAKQLGAGHGADSRVKRAREIVRRNFPGKPLGPPVSGAPWTPRSIEEGHYSGATPLGILRIREHMLFRKEFALDDFTAVLGEIFATG
jgi:hypothetical protein